MTKKKELHDMEYIEELVESCDNANTVEMSADVYRRLMRSFYPKSRFKNITEDMAIEKLHLNDDTILDVEVVPGENVSRVVYKEPKK